MSGDGLPIDATTGALDAARQDVMKAHVFSHERPAPQNLQGVDDVEKVFGYAGAIEPPHNPATLVTLFEHSSALRQNVDSYVTNIDAFGHRFDPILDLEAADADARISNYLLQRREGADPAAVADPLRQVGKPTPDEVAAEKAELAEKMRVERTAMQHFFEFCCIDISFATLRRRTRQDIEVLGNGFWEVLRDAAEQICQFDYIAGFTVRLLPLDTVPTKTKMRVKVNDFDYEVIEVTRFFRRYVQVFEARCVYFKELGDPRVVSRKTGAVFPSLDELLAKNENDGPATEIIHFKVHNPRSAYGVPRWIGTLLSVLGSRQAEEVNYMYFENKSVPPLALLVSGGRVSEETVSRIRDFIENDVKGKKNFHKLLVLEADSGGQASPGAMEHSGRMKIDLKPLTAAQHNDALFQNYDERNIDKVGMSFRLPRMLRGDIRDFNRATAEAAIEFAEMQVFGPERDEFDFLINRKILPELDTRFWKFKSNAPSTRNPKDLAEMVGTLTKGGVLTPAEARDLAEGIFNRELRKIDAPWVRQPLELTVAGIAPPDELAAPGMAGPNTPPPILPVGDTPLGVATGAGGNLPPLPAVEEPKGGVQLTGTMLATIVTVNEARADYGKPPLKRPDGTEDPDGFLTVAEFEAKRTARGEAQGERQGGKPGQAPPAQLANRRPGNAELLEQALQMIALRKVLERAEEAEARAEFEDAHAAGDD